MQPTSGGLGYLGFRIFPNQVRVKSLSVKRAVGRLKRKLAAARNDSSLYPDFIASLRGTFAHFRHADTWHLKAKFLRELRLAEEGEDPPGHFALQAKEYIDSIQKEWQNETGDEEQTESRWKE